MTRVLITGVSGFVGAHITQALLQKGFEVYGIHRKESDLSRLSKIIDRIRLYQADLRVEEQVDLAMRTLRPDAVIHCAGYGILFEQQDMQELLRSNLYTTLYMIKAAAKYGVERTIHTGSCSEFNSFGGIIPESQVPNPTNFYGVTKAAATLMALQQASSLGIKLVVLRLFNLFGPHEHAHRVITAMLRACLDKKPLALTSGEQVRDYTYVEDIATLYTDLLIRKDFPANDVFHIGSGIGYSLKSIGEMVENLTKQKGFLLWGQRANRPHEMHTLVADISKAKSILNWTPRTTLLEGLKKMREILI